MQHADQLFKEPLDLTSVDVTALAAWPEGCLNVVALLEYAEIALDFGVEATLELLMTTASRKIFTDDLAKVIIQDRLLHSPASDEDDTFFQQLESFVAAMPAEEMPGRVHAVYVCLSAPPQKRLKVSSDELTLTVPVGASNNASVSHSLPRSLQLATSIPLDQIKELTVCFTDWG